MQLLVPAHRNNVPQVTVTLQGSKQKHVAIVDTAASHNFVSRSVAPAHRTTTTKVSLAISDSSTVSTGSVMMTLDINGIPYQVEFMVVPKLRPGIILRSPFLTEQKVILDYERSCLHLRKQRRKCVYWKRTTATCGQPGNKLADAVSRQPPNDPVSPEDTDK